MKKKKRDGRVGMIEARLCEICRKPLVSRGFFYIKKTCSERCKMMRWGLVEANKVMQKNRRR